MHRVTSTPPASTVAAIALVAALATTLHAHGGQYRGPSSVVPPSGAGSTSSSSGGGTRATSGPSAPSGTSGNSSAGSSSPQPAPGSASIGTRGARGIFLDSDLTSWEFWWEFQKDPLIRVRDGLELRRAYSATDALLGRPGAAAALLEPPSAREVELEAIPALVRALEQATDRDTVSSCMIALAKVGKDPAGARLHDLLASRLRSHDQEIRETAALALGIARQCGDEDLELLLALAKDLPSGRQACDRSSVDDRTRSFACYALGICLERLDPPRQQPVVRALLQILATDEIASAHRNVAVAAIAALGQLPRSDTPAGRTLREVTVRGLLAFYDLDLGPGAQLVQAHCPMAVAHLLGPDHELSAECRNRFVAHLSSSLTSDASGRAKTSDHIAQSAALALASLCHTWTDDAAEDAGACRLLLRCYREHRDHQTRYFAMLALGRIGGTAAASALTSELERGTRSIERPWVALALGTMAAEQAEEARAEGRTPQSDPALGQTLMRLLEDAKNPSAIGATAIALGLCRTDAAGDLLRRLLPTYGAREDVGGQIAIALALLEERRAAPDLRELLARSVRQPRLLVQVATALGRLGDAQVVEQLVTMLQSLDGGLARLSAVASALGQLGDRRCVAPLVDLLQNQEVTPLTRAFAAVALGGVCDPDAVPWNARYAFTVNYRAAVETLTDGATGILDIL